MATTKITKKMNAQAILNLMESMDDESVLATVGDVDITVKDATEYLNHEVELLDKKRTSKGSKKVNEENQRLQGIILEVLSTMDGAKTVSEIQKMNEELDGLSNQKVSALIRGLVTDDKVVKTTEKGKSLFALA